VGTTTSSDLTRGLGLGRPRGRLPDPRGSEPGMVRQRGILGGLIHEYYADAPGGFEFRALQPRGPAAGLQPTSSTISSDTLLSCSTASSGHPLTPYPQRPGALLARTMRVVRGVDDSGSSRAGSPCTSSIGGTG
jgi:hypothetical protein